MASSKELWIGCRDVTGRRRELSVRATDDSVVVVASPGEAAVLWPSEASELRAALREAVLGSSTVQP